MRGPMRVLVWACGFETRFAGPYIAAEAKRQGLEVRVCGSRENPRQMLPVLESYKPDLVLSCAIRPQLRGYYDIIRATGAKLALWYPDMTEARRDRMWRNYLDNATDVLIFSILETAQRYQELAPTVLWMPQYFDHRFCSDANGNLPKRLDPSKPIYDVCFIGSCDPLRDHWLDHLEQRYRCFFHRDGIKNRHELRGYRMAEVYAQSKIAINIQRELFMNCGSFVTSNRMYNAMGSGAFYINHVVKDLDLVFTPGKHCVMHADTLNDLCWMIDEFLREERLREEIAYAGQQEVLKHHTLEQRVKEYWTVFQAVVDGKAGSIPPGAFGQWVKK